MSLTIKHFYQFGEFILDSDQKVLLREDKPVSLTLKVFETLVILVENSGRIVTKAELMEKLWPDSFVEEANLTYNIQQLRKALGDNARQPTYIETVARRGYRFIAAVEEVLSDDLGMKGQVSWRVEVSDGKMPGWENRQEYQPITEKRPVWEIAQQEGKRSQNDSPATNGQMPAAVGELSRVAAATGDADTGSRAPARFDEKGLTTPKDSSGTVLPDQSKHYKPLVVSALALLLVGALILAFYALYSKRAAPRPLEKKSIAVLPVKPINTAIRDEVYEIGIADSLILRLSSIKGFVVRPLSATRKYVDVNQDPLAAGHEQQVDYVLDSNYQLVGGKIRVTAQLFDVSTGQIEETYKTEKDAGNIFALQDALADEVGKLLLARYATTFGSPAEKRGTTNEEAYRFYLKGMYFFDRRDGSKAVEAFEQAVRLDPNYARAWAGIAHAHRTVGNLIAGADVHEGYRKSIEAINRA